MALGKWAEHGEEVVKWTERAGIYGKGLAKWAERAGTQGEELAKWADRAGIRGDLAKLGAKWG